jgi:hypothetical protein
VLRELGAFDQLVRSEPNETVGLQILVPDSDIGDLQVSELFVQQVEEVVI